MSTLLPTQKQLKLLCCNISYFIAEVSTWSSTASLMKPIGAETVDCLRSFSIMLPNLCWSWALYQVCWVVTYSSLVTVWALCYLHRNNLNCFVVTFLTSLLKFQPGHPQPHWWSLLGQKQSTVWGVLVLCSPTYVGVEHSTRCVE